MLARVGPTCPSESLEGELEDVVGAGGSWAAAEDLLLGGGSDTRRAGSGVERTSGDSMILGESSMASGDCVLDAETSVV